MSEDKINVIRHIQFQNMKVPVYYVHSTNAGYTFDQKNNSCEDYLYCAWRARNPSSFYVGPMFMDKNGKMSYPEGAVVPEQTSRDRELVPRFILIGTNELTPKIEGNLQEYLENEHRRRNTPRHKEDS